MTTITRQEPAPLALWGGVECTVNRVGDRVHDQLHASGHHHRPCDIERIAGLGVRAVRYPVLWERTEPSPGRREFAWSDRRLRLLRARGVTPIVGLVHHGSGPRHTDLLDPQFPRLLADFAGAVARRYPWVELYTPVNEPLTTARFSGLYGHWYPHHRSDASFCRALIHQCLATQRAMREIQRINPAARLLHTEDLGATLSTPALRYQAEFENRRRFLSHDLLGGRVGRDHPLYPYLLKFGVTEGELAELRDQPPPDLLGVNHYVTSVRFLDDRIEHYPAGLVGGNGRHHYVDVEAVRVCDDAVPGPYELLCELAARYGLPIAVTEAHLACHVDEQIRWFDELWRAALRCREAGVDVRAVTAWSLFGAFDWHCLVTRETGRYEPGAFDVRDGTPRPTELARYLAGLARGETARHPALAVPGWWRQPSRLIYPSPASSGRETPHHADAAVPPGA
ncbi:family 1 glycosylhydrolase [Nannocystis bainbridge]|uniref:Family 1 glycosylhydrolase n=1 Tax=Nannocystis bainbridge TaxID=2995303 RepID=A0ABT5DSI6_9BACT|nr:family 1 glycosylhydrolase [Nannocystis bainbridge]MDC0715698.1 family 1 glycosylhydrolase [Nannocystis bainbridge]